METSERAPGTGPEATVARSRTGSIAGGALTLAAAVVLLGIITAEALYPATYSTGRNDISDLGGTRPPEGLVLQPSATIFDATMLAAGVLVLGAAWLLVGAGLRRSVLVPLVLLGVGCVGVGVFPGDTGTPHALASLLTFVSGAVAAISASRLTSGPFRLVTAALGVVSLAMLVVYTVAGDAGPLADLGPGGVERWVAYPIVSWIGAFGGWLAGAGEAPGINRARRRP